jgi:hypothetical protein
MPVLASVGGAVTFANNGYDYGAGAPTASIDCPHLAAIGGTEPCTHGVEHICVHDNHMPSCDFTGVTVGTGADGVYFVDMCCRFKDQQSSQCP